MLMDSEKLKNEIDNRLEFLINQDDNSFKNGYELALTQLKDWIIYNELLLEVFNCEQRNQG